MSAVNSDICPPKKLQQIKVFNGTEHVANIPRGCYVRPAKVPYAICSYMLQFALSSDQEINIGTWKLVKDY